MKGRPSQSSNDLWMVVHLPLLLLLSVKRRHWTVFTHVGRLLGLGLLFGFAIVGALSVPVPWILDESHQLLGWGIAAFSMGVGTWLVVRYGDVFVQRPTDRTDQTDGPPRVARYLLFLVPPKYRENLVGDLDEEYRMHVLPIYGRWWASLWYWWQVAVAFGHFLLHLLAGLASVWKLIR